MKISFTGTRNGMTPEQALIVVHLLARFRPTEIHHGDCVGADIEFAQTCHTIEPLIPRPRIIAHPGESARGGWNQFKGNFPHNDEVWEVKAHFARNRDMVDLLGADDVLIATPFSMDVTNGGGTWYTINYARKRGVRVMVVCRDGAIEGES